MRKRRILYFLEPAVHTILLRQLTKKGYRIYPKVRLGDAIGKDSGDHLPSREFEYLMRAHLDFVVVKDDMPIFGVEFDGQSHREPTAVERDVLKNRLCKAADLPLLRITSAEVSERDQHSVLDYMLMRYVAWQEEIGGIVEEIHEFASGLPDDIDPNDYAVDFDPTFHFDLRHPFPGTALVQERLWRNYRIAPGIGGRGYESGSRDSQPARYLCDVGTQKHSGSFRDDQFTTCALTVLVWEPTSSSQNPVMETTVEVSIRAWLPLQHVVPEAPSLALSGLAGLAASSQQLIARIESMWFPSLPGISPWDIAENYAEYLGFRAIETWAKSDQTSKGK